MYLTIVSTSDQQRAYQMSVSHLSYSLANSMTSHHVARCTTLGFYQYLIPSLIFNKKPNQIIFFEPCHEKTGFLHNVKTKPQIGCSQLIGAFVFHTWIVLFFLNLKFQNSSNLPLLHRLFCLAPGQKPQRPVFSRHGSF